MLRVAFRTDASPATGQGHLSRCLALAARLHARGIHCHFVGTETLRYWVAGIEAAGHQTSLIPEGLEAREDAAATLRALGTLRPDWLVIDHYGLDARWHEAVRRAAPRLLAIDDLANRPLAVDAVLDPSPCAEAAAYRALSTEGCELLLGPTWCLLREEFATARIGNVRTLSEARGGLRIHLALGGTDPAGATLPIAKALLDWFASARVIAVLGQEGPSAQVLREFADASGGRLEALVATREVASTMARCDCAVGAPGGTLWERFCLGLPTACVTTAPSQRPVIERLASEGWLLDLGEACDFGEGQRGALARWLSNAAALRSQRSRLTGAVDGLGAERLAGWMAERVR
ncbi:UDP-2,4-diacetamido-2,4,6-trideoxy-beta-L-altropyranose hydrolase [Acidovorax sp. ACV02]|uniref:UDP-2,4-diacetamido-2,4, 6-trideoxy-beta-L-altropyranose hydrolase n=1 Tax=Acidovorax sp. ACV02 TaxID=2769310 RepID=UPI001CE21D11|nr:UDP-2,4-diacetamido-2,4,6-trideoxy-beta-L-altropyranose hydrolase [Acidovorax sp. ACV02]